jgi:hypothetical protein
MTFEFGLGEPIKVATVDKGLCVQTLDRCALTRTSRGGPMKRPVGIGNDLFKHFIERQFPPAKELQRFSNRDDALIIIVELR